MPNFIVCVPNVFFGRFTKGTQIKELFDKTQFDFLYSGVDVWFSFKIIFSCN